jgi:hypothetical protein
VCELVGGRILGVGAHTSRHTLERAQLGSGLWVVVGAPSEQRVCKGSAISQGLFKGANHLQANSRKEGRTLQGVHISRSYLLSLRGASNCYRFLCIDFLVVVIA